jgi:arylformamidase
MPNIYRHIADLETLEREYSPSRWVPDLGVILRDYAQRSEAALAAAPLLRTLAYGTSPEESMDFFPAPRASDGHPKPVVVYIHGGYWQELSKNEHSFLAPGFNRQGVHYIAVNYGLAPAVSLAEMIDRCRRSIAWLHEHAAELGIAPDQIHLTGCSAGGHLAAMTALGDLPQPLASLTLLSGVYDLRPIVPTYINDAVGLTIETALMHSPLLRVDTTTAPWPPTLVAVAANEPDEFKRQSAEFTEALTRRGFGAELHEFADRNHFDLVFDLADPTTPLGSMLRSRIEESRTGLG